MPNIEQITHFFETYWPALLALGSLTTFVNNLVQRLPDRFARVKNIVNTVSVDFVALLAEVGGALNIGPRKPPPSNGTTIKTRISSIPPAAMGIVFATLFLGCTRAQEARALPTLDFAQAVAQKAETVLDFVEPLLPPGDAQVATARAAQAAGDLGKVFDVARPLLERVAAGGEDVPQQLVADVVIGAQAAKAIEQGVRALDGRNPDGTLKQDGGP
jgi:hypothetical protein